METANKLIDKLPAEYFMVLIPILLVVGIFWILPRIKRDKNGKLYFYSQIYESKQQSTKIKENFGELKECLTRLELDNQRLRILNLIQHSPNEKIAINAEFDDYLKKGGNSYIVAIVEEWRKNAIN
jgi:hypothetical protein